MHLLARSPVRVTAAQTPSYPVEHF